MEDIEAELEAKSIERDVEIKEVISELEPEPEPEPVAPAATLEVKKTKKPRSEKQIAAFEKARIKRAEGIANRKKLKEEQKLQKKEEKKQVKLQDVAVPIVQENSIPKPVVNTPAQREQVIQNHYYYYGVPPPNHDNNKPKKSKKSKRPPTPSSSESESSDEELPDNPPSGGHPPRAGQSTPQQYYQPAKPSYKFSYA